MTAKVRPVIILVFFSIIGLATACSPLAKVPESDSASTEGEAADQAASNLVRDPDVPDLPFPDNPDPDQCGIPVEWGDDDQAWLNGRYDGELIQPTVYLYDSHLRLSIKAQAPHGTEVQVVLYQENPVTDYYMVQIPGREGPESRGWIPAPLLSFEPVD